MLKMENNLKQSILDTIKNVFNIEINDLKLSKPPKAEMWDYAFNCWILSRELKKNPIEIANELLTHLEKIVNVEKITLEGAFVNIKISKSVITDLFYSLENNLDFSNYWKWEKIIVDYIWANVWKPLHIGHMCTPLQWQSLINLYKKLWYDVISDSHIGDWWIIFWKLITAYKLWWDEDKLKMNAVDYLLELYVKITTESEEKWDLIDDQTRNEFKLLSEWNEKSIELWTMFTRYSIDAMNRILARLSVKPDYNIWESFYAWLGLPKMEEYPDLKHDMSSIVKELIESSIAIQNDDNSVWIEFPDNSNLPSCILQKRDWTHWYFASDLASIKYRCENWNPKKIVYCVDSRQQMHLKQAFEVSKLAWWIWNTELFHAYNGFISLKDGAMSTRKWRIIKLDWLLDEAENRAKKIILEKREDISGNELENLSRIIWIGAIKYWYLKKSRETDVVFDWDEFMTFEWNSWPYIQYAYVRSLRILEKYDWDFNIDVDVDFEEQDEIELVKILSNYKKELINTSLKNTPHNICRYSYELTKAFNSFYNNVHILNEENEDKKILRLKLIKHFSETLKDSFWLVWIEMPNKM